VKNDGHTAIVNAGITAVPGEIGEFWSTLREDVLSTRGDPDKYALDLLQNKRGAWGRFFPKHLKYNFEIPQRLPRDFLPDTAFYIRHTVEELRRGNNKEAAKFAGVFSHYLGDFAEPAHYYEFDAHRLLPPPADMANSNFHFMVEGIDTDVKRTGRKGQILGKSKAELQFRLEGDLCRLQKRSIAAIFPMLQAIYRRRNHLATRTFNAVVRESAECFSDFIMSVKAIADSQIPSRDSLRLADCRLIDIEPHDWDVEFNYGNRPLINYVTPHLYGSAEAFTLLKDGKMRKVDGICPIPHALPIKGMLLESTITYHLPKNVFHSFTATVGLHAKVKKQPAVYFLVSDDGQNLFQSKWLHSTKEAMPIEVDISKCRKLSLKVITDGSTDKLAFPIWGNPTLHKH